MPQHGGDLSWLMRHYPEAPGPLIDLSTGINPYAYPQPPIEPEWLHRLPDSGELQTVIAAAAHYYGAPPEHLALGAGMQPLMFALAALRFKMHGSSRIAISLPAYGEHARIWRESGHSICHDSANVDVVVTTNPNNPDGCITPPEELLALAEMLAKRDGWLIIDESFADLMPQLSLVAQVCGRPNLAVLRSCGKFFGLAGLRASSAVAPAAWASWLRMATGPWPISTAACRLLPAMLSDAAWIARMRRRLDEEAETWRVLLARHFALRGHTSLFTLAETPEAPDWREHLAAQGILARAFDDQPDWLRFGLPDARHMARIRAALETR